MAQRTGIPALGRRIRSFRGSARLTQRQVAAQLGFSHTWLAHIEAGTRGISTEDLRRLADILDVPFHELADIPVPAQELPMVSLEQIASAGGGAEALGEAVGDARYVTVTVAGDSMKPMILEGDTLILDREVQPQGGDYVVGVIDDRVYVKRLAIRGGWPVLISANGKRIPGKLQGAVRVREVRRVV